MFWKFQKKLRNKTLKNQLKKDDYLLEIVEVTNTGGWRTFQPKRISYPTYWEPSFFYFPNWTMKNSGFEMFFKAIGDLVQNQDTEWHFYQDQITKESAKPTLQEGFNNA